MGNMMGDDEVIVRGKKMLYTREMREPGERARDGRVTTLYSR